MIQDELDAQQKLESMLLRATNIMNKAVPEIQHNKARAVMRLLNKEITEVLNWSISVTDSLISAIDSFPDKTSDRAKEVSFRLEEHQQFVEETMNLLVEQLGPDQQLGQWLNQDQKYGQKYRDLMKESFAVTVPEPPKGSLTSRLLPRRLNKALQSTQNFKDKLVGLKTPIKAENDTATASESSSSKSQFSFNNPLRKP